MASVRAKRRWHKSVSTASSTVTHGQKSTLLAQGCCQHSHLKGYKDKDTDTDKDKDKDKDKDTDKDTDKDKENV